MDLFSPNRKNILNVNAECWQIYELRKQFGSVFEYKILYYNNPNTAKAMYTKIFILKGQPITA